MRLIAIGLAGLLSATLAGCGVQRAMSANDARERYEQSSADYRACLANQAPTACEGRRLIMETNERSWLNLRQDPEAHVIVRSR